MKQQRRHSARKLLDQRTFKRLSDAFLADVPDIDEKAKLVLAKKLVSAFLKDACLSASERRSYFADFAFHMGELAADLSKLQQLFSHPSKSSDVWARKVLEDFLWHAANHVHAAATLYTGWTVTYLVPLKHPKKPKPMVR